MTFGDNCYSLAFGEGCYSMTFGKACNNLMLPDNSTYGTINILGSITGGGSGMDLAGNDPTLFQTWLGAGNESNLINTARDNGDYATCMSLDATIYIVVNCSI